MLAIVVVMTWLLGAAADCKKKCGDVEIPFPFGIGLNCSMDEWFEIACENRSGATSLQPRLRRINVDVINITVDRLSWYDNRHQGLQVKSPVEFMNCTGKENRPTVNLSGSPFQFSYSNTFVAVSCGVMAKLDLSSGLEFSEIGCRSVCSATGTKINTTLCNGTDCCETKGFPREASRISFVQGASPSSEGDPCKFAFLVDEDYWAEYKNRSSSFAEISDAEFVPISLGWEMRYSYLEIFKTNMSKRNPIRCVNTQASSTGFIGDGSPDDMSIATEPPLRCYCKGLHGNPYLIDGCTQDINECNDLGYEPCGRGSTCVNKHGSYYCSYKRKYILIGLGSALGALFLLFGPWCIYKQIKKIKDNNHKKRFFKQNGGLLLQQQLLSNKDSITSTKLFSSDELTKATGNFSLERVLGQGAQGTVYKGMLEDGKIVAVKKSKIVDKSKLSEFINEVVILSQINHRNVVQLLGCCLETEVPILVYEFIPNGTLSKYIHTRNGDFPFTWKMRTQIARQVAAALSYLHSAASIPIFHRDIKSANILLDEKYQAKVADFGTSRTISIEESHLTTLVYGTFGYLDPEYFQSGQFTDKSDVYSFGVVLCELLTGDKAICASRTKTGSNLATHFVMSMETDNLFDIIDAQILNDAPKEEIVRTANLALRCLCLNGRNRPTMKEVAIELEAVHKSDTEASYSYNENYNEFTMPWDESSLPVSSTFNTTRSDSNSIKITQSSQQQELPFLHIEA